MLFGKDREGDSNTPYQDGRNPENPGDPDRVKTGIPRLDYILKGGFVTGGTYLLFGPPGSGKTILANQLCFNLIRQDQKRCLYVTLLTESYAKMTRHLRQLSFYDESRIAEHSLTYLSGYQVLEKEGLKGLLKLIQSALSNTKASILILDGLESVKCVVREEGELSKFLHELMALTQIYGTTSLLLSAPSQNTSAPERSIVDGVIELSLQLLGPRSVREVSVHKFRGSDFLQGKHETEITQNGIQIHPRTEIQFDRPTGNAQEQRIRMGFGVESLDRMIAGGPLSGSTTAILGSPGTGKTFLGLSFLVEGAKQGHGGIYYGFYEPPPRLIEKARGIGLPLEKYVKSGQIELLWQPPLEHFLDSLAEQLLEKVRKENFKERRRLFIDGVEGFRASNVYPERMGRFLSAFTNQLRTLDVTTLISEELGLFQPNVNMPNPELGHVVESIILLRSVELRSQLYRLVSVLKMRESKYDTSIREFQILDSGITVSGTFDSAEQILTGTGRTTYRHGSFDRSNIEEGGQA